MLTLASRQIWKITQRILRAHAQKIGSGSTELLTKRQSRPLGTRMLGNWPELNREKANYTKLNHSVPTRSCTMYDTFNNQVIGCAYLCSFILCSLVLFRSVSFHKIPLRKTFTYMWSNFSVTVLTSRGGDFSRALIELVFPLVFYTLLRRENSLIDSKGWNLFQSKRWRKITDELELEILLFSCM